MKCEQVPELLTALLLGDLDEATRAEVETHSEQCEGCRAQRRELELTLDLVRDALSASSSTATIPQRLTPDRRARVTSTPPARQPIRMLSWLSVPHPRLAMAAAACLVLAFVIAGLMLPAASSSREKAMRAAKAADRSYECTVQTESILDGVDRFKVTDGTKSASAPKPQILANADDDGVAAVDEVGTADAGGGGGGGRMARRTRTSTLSEGAAVEKMTKDVREMTELTYKADAPVTTVNGTSGRAGKMGAGGGGDSYYYKAKGDGDAARPAAPSATMAPPQPQPPPAVAVPPGAVAPEAKAGDDTIMFLTTIAVDAGAKKQKAAQNEPAKWENLAGAVKVQPIKSPDAPAARGSVAPEKAPAAVKPFSVAAAQRPAEEESLRRGLVGKDEVEVKESLTRRAKMDEATGDRLRETEERADRSGFKLRSNREVAAAPTAVARSAVGKEDRDGDGLSNVAEFQKRLAVNAEVGARDKASAVDATVASFEQRRHGDVAKRSVGGAAADRPVDPAASRDLGLKEEAVPSREVARQEIVKEMAESVPVPVVTDLRAEGPREPDLKDMEVMKTRAAEARHATGKSRLEVADAISERASATPPADASRSRVVRSDDNGKQDAGRYMDTKTVGGVPGPTTRKPVEGQAGAWANFSAGISDNRDGRSPDTKPPAKPAAVRGEQLAKSGPRSDVAPGAPARTPAPSAADRGRLGAAANGARGSGEKSADGAKTVSGSTEPTPAATTRQKMEGFYEGWWRETSHVKEGKVTTATNAMYVFPEHLPKVAEAKELPAKFRAFGVNPVVECASQPFSTFSIDVDTASYTISRNYMLRGQRPPAEAVRTEEFVNFFDYAYTSPAKETFRVYAEAAPSKFGRGMHLLKIGVKGKRLGREEQRGAILTFLVDTSGSMDKPDRIGLVRKSLKILLDKLSPQDQVAIVQFDSNVRLALDHTPASEKEKIAGVLDALQCSGSTHLEGGMTRAYEVAARSFKANAENRVLILSDGVANLGTMAAEDILARVEAYRKQGIYCSVFGFGIGTFDDTMLQTLADKGNGAYAFIDSEAEAKRVFVDDLAATLNTIAADVKIQVEFNPKRVAKYRQIGYEKRQLKKEDFRNDAVDAGEVGSGQSVTALYEVELKDSRDVVATVRLRYRRTDNNRVEEIERAVTAADLKPDFDKADARFRLAACAAEFSEQLRGSPHAAGSDFADVASALRPVALELPLDTQVQELLRLVQSAGSLSLAAQ